MLESTLFKLETKLPLELRETIYEYIVGASSPKVLPKSEGNDRQAFDGWADSAIVLDPFKDEPLFEGRIMGIPISDEIREAFIKTTTLYLRGSHQAERLKTLFNMEVTPGGKKVRDLTQHVRMYLRCENFARDSGERMQGPSFGIASWEEDRRQGILRHYDMYRWRLQSLDALPFEDRRIKVEICVFTTDFEMSPHIYSDAFHKKRELFNLLESVKPAYFSAKHRGAELYVRCEEFSTGEGMDVTWMFDLDANAWKELS